MKNIGLEDVLKNGFLIALVDDPSEHMCFAAIGQNPKSYKFIKNPTEAVSIEAVTRDSNLLQFVPYQTEKIIDAALEQDKKSNNGVWRSIRNLTQDHALKLAKSTSGESIFFVEVHTDEFLIKAAKMAPASINYAKHFCIDAVKIAINEVPALIKHQKNPSEDLCILAVTKDPKVLQYVNTQTEKIILAAVSISGECLKYAHHQTTEIALAAVNENGYNIQYVIDQSEKVVMAAVEQNPGALVFVKQPSQEVCLKALSENGFLLNCLNFQTDEICLAAVNNAGQALEMVWNPTPEICLAAVKQDYLALGQVKEITEELCLAAIKENCDSICFVLNRTNFGADFYLKCVKENGLVLRYLHSIKNSAIELEAVKQNWQALQYVDDKNEVICLEAYSQDIRAIALMEQHADRYNTIVAPPLLLTKNTVDQVLLEKWDIQRTLECALEKKRGEISTPLNNISRRRLDNL